MRPRTRLVATALIGAAVALGVQPVAHAGPGLDPHVFPSLSRNLVAFYDFEHPHPGDPTVEVDRGRSGTPIDLVNGGAQMRVADGAYPASTASLQVRQIAPDVAGNDDWKAGVYDADGVSSLAAFGDTRGATVMGWVQMSGAGPAPNSTTPDPTDVYNAIGLAGVLAGGSDGHGVRALLELIQVDGELRLVALGRRLDDGASQTFAATEDWRTLLPAGEWVFLAATFDFDRGRLALYRNGERIDGELVNPDDPWEVEGPPEPDRTSPTAPAGIKIGGSFPQNTEERNPCDCRLDALMFLDRSVTGAEIAAQYRWVTRGPLSR